MYLPAAATITHPILNNNLKYSYRTSYFTLAQMIISLERLFLRTVLKYSSNYCLFLSIFIGIIDAVFLFQQIKEHFVLLRVAYLLLIANIIRHYLVAQGFLSKIDQHTYRTPRCLEIIQQLRYKIVPNYISNK